MAALLHRPFDFSGIGLIALCVLLTACGGPVERKDKYRTKAHEYIQAGNFPKARVALRNVLKIDPKDADAYFLYAQVEEKDKNLRNALTHYQRVIELRPNHEGALVKLGKFYLQGRLDEKAHEIADQLLRLHPGHVSARAINAALAAAEGKLKEATVEGEVLIAQFPTDPDAAILQSTLYSLQKAPQRGGSGLEKSPRSPSTGS